MLIIVVEIDLSRDSLGCTDTHLLISLRINVELKVIDGIMVIVVVILLVNDLSVLVNFYVGSSFPIHKGQLPEGHQILGVFNLHEQEMVISGFFILKESMKLVFFFQLHVGELTRLRHNLINLLRLVGILEGDNVDLVVVRKEQVFLAKPNMAN